MTRVAGVFDFAVELARKAGVLIRETFHGSKEVATKSCRTDLVTDTDTKVEKMVIEEIRAKYPTHKFIGEESAVEGVPCDLTDEPTWIIDPVDGTSNFYKAFPFCCISIGYCEDKKPVVGVIYNPIKEELYAAEHGKGATLNGQPIRVKEFESVEKCLIITDVGTQRSEKILDTKVANMRRVINHILGIRTFGSAALSIAMVGGGLADGYFEFGLHCWDMAAGMVIVGEAGGVIASCDGSPVDMMSRNVFVANSQATLDAVCPLLDCKTLLNEYTRD